MRFSSSVEAVATEKNELFNALSLYVPKAMAPSNIRGWVDQDLDAEVTATTPVVITVDVTNYASVMEGVMLDQFTDAFRQDSNIDLVIYIIVFDDSGSFVVGSRSITYAPLTAAFEKLFFISYVKMLFDLEYDGSTAVIPYPGTKASRTIMISNQTLDYHTLPAGTYYYDDGVKTYKLEVLVNMVVPPSGGNYADIVIEATTVGVDSALADGDMPVGNFTPLLEDGPELLTFTTTAHVQGINANPTPAPVPSKYFDFSLALAYQCKLNVKLSYFWSLVKVSLSQTGYPVASDVDTNPCRITSITAGDEAAYMLALDQAATGPVPIPRTQYYWGALNLMAVPNTWVLVHSEAVNVFAEVLGAWFASRNTSGTYIGNKMSLLRLSGVKIKPLGYPSWLNNAVNENFGAAFDLLDTKNVGYLQTIADDTPQDCAVSSARGITGIPFNAMEIAKFVDYTSAQDCAKFITDKGTLTNPVLTDEAAYKQIQEVVKNNLLKFSGTSGRLLNISLNFPAFSSAKTGATKLEAASAWSALYKDDLNTIVVSGGITAQ